VKLVVLSTRTRHHTYFLQRVAARFPIEAVLFDLTWLRPATGIPPKDQARVVGRTLTRDIAAGAVLTWDDLGGVETGAG